MTIKTIKELYNWAVSKGIAEFQLLAWDTNSYGESGYSNLYIDNCYSPHIIIDQQNKQVKI